MEKQIKSKIRIQKHGEVFTPQWMVNQILDLPEIKESCENIYSTFLEPAAGDGNFLVAILRKKLKAVEIKYKKSNWKSKSLIVLSTIYGIEILEDNVYVSRSRMFLYYLDWYEKNFGVRLQPNSDYYKSAQYIIKNNIVRGNTITRRHPETNEQIILFEWRLKNKKSNTVKKIRFSLSELLGEGVTEYNYIEGQMNIFDMPDIETSDALIESIDELNILKIYKFER